MKIRALIIPALCLTLFSCARGPKDGDYTLTVLSTNDVHGCGSLVGVASSGAVVKNVTLEGYIRLSTLWDYWGTTALSTDWGAGAIAEYAEGSADGVPGLTIENCHFIGTIINDQSTANPNDNPYAGGLVGWVDNETLAWTNAPAGTVNVVISNSTVNAETVSAYQWAGGLVGIGWGVKVDDCSVTGTVSNAKSLGDIAAEVRKSWFTDCSFSGTVVTPRSISRSPMSGGGGLVGVAADVEFRNCSATGLVNFRARWYDPVTGRWLSKDPIGLSGGLNLYAFCGGDPMSFIDPGGLDKDANNKSNSPVPAGKLGPPRRGPSGNTYRADPLGHGTKPGTSDPKDPHIHQTDSRGRTRIFDLDGKPRDKGSKLPKVDIPAFGKAVWDAMKYIRMPLPILLMPPVLDMPPGNLS